MCSADILFKLILISPAMISKMPISILIPLMGFIIQFPQTFFADPSYQFIYLVQSVFVSLILFIFIAVFAGNNGKLYNEKIK